MNACALVLENESLFRIILSFIRTVDSSSNLHPNELIYVPLKGGSKATLYRFELNKSSYVLRLFPPQASRLTRMHQIILAKQASKIGVGPEVYFVDPQMEGIVMEFIPGRTMRESDFEDSAYLAIFAKFIHHLHRSEERFPLASSPFQRFHNFLLKGEQKKVVYPLRFSEVKTLMEELEATFQLMPISLVPAHLDLHPLNIMIAEKKFLLVDWVNGGLSDPYFDLATFTVFQGLNESQILIFLTHYFERDPTQLEWNRFIITQPIRLFVIAAALLSLSTNVTPSISYQEALESSELPTIRDFGKEGMNWPYWQFGLTMLKAGLKIIDQDNFKIALKNLQKYAFHTFMNV